MQWAPVVMVRVTAFFVTGIILSMHQLLPASVSLASGVAVFLTAFYLFSVLLFKRSPHLKLWSGVMGLMTIIVMGWLCYLLRDPLVDPNHFKYADQSVEAYHVQLASEPTADEKSWRASANIHSILAKKGWNRCVGKVNIRVRRVPGDSIPGFHDYVLIQGSPEEVRPATNPHEFDRKKYLASQGIFHQDFVDTGQWKLTAKAQTGFLYYSIVSRQWCLDQFTRFIPGIQERAIVSALVLGVTDEIDPEVRNAYAATGVIHVLAVSGLHVSIIYGILLFFLKGLNKSLRGKWMVTIVSIAVLWSYAFLTGLSPSVLRAVTMFTFTSLAIPMRRRSNILNTLGVSAFLLLLFDPRMILSVGFQLSYLAVLGIVLLYPSFYQRWRPELSINRWIWQMTCVSMAAQAFTFPWSLYYFHQFPVYFLAANFIAIPAGFVILVAGLALVGLSGLPWLAAWLGKLLGWFVMLLNYSIDFIQDLPGSLITHVYVTLGQCVTLYLLLLSFCLLFYYRRFAWVPTCVVLTVVYSAMDWHQHFSNRGGSMIVYDIRNHSAVEWLKESSSLFLADKDLSPMSVLYQIEPNRLAHEVRNVRNMQPDDSMGMVFVRWCGKDFLFVNKPWRGQTLNLKVECLIIAQGAMTASEAMKAGIDFGHLITDSSNGLHFEEGAGRGEEGGYDVRRRGAFVIQL